MQYIKYWLGTAKCLATIGGVSRHQAVLCPLLPPLPPLQDSREEGDQLFVLTQVSVSPPQITIHCALTRQ